MTRAAKHAAAETTDAPPKKSKKRLLIILTFVLLLLVGGGIAAFLLLAPAQPQKHGAAESGPAKFVELGSYTANLMREDGDRYLQISISLKITKPDLEEKIKISNPEIQHHLNMLLQSKHPSEIATFEGKQRLADQIKGEVEYVLGLRKTPPSPTDAPATTRGSSGISDVLFTSFIIQ